MPMGSYWTSSETSVRRFGWTSTHEAMMNPEWKGPDYELRHIWTRCAVHGFHHRGYMSKAYHMPAVECICKRCDRYHALSCERRPSLKDLCSDQEL
ncbi:hypothetical protein C0J52_12961 [Blattella germanica]|nr:hypothetical protein C0J52_12961 [Blattella germanica]